MDGVLYALSTLQGGCASFCMNVCVCVDGQACVWGASVVCAVDGTEGEGVPHTSRLHPWLLLCVSR